MSQSSNKRSKWFACYHPRPEAKLRLIGFPHGGGGPQAFREWSKLLPDDIEVVAVSLPGRTPRLDEPLITNMDELVPQIVERLMTYFDKPFVFFGHSMGAAVAFEVTRVLTQLDYPLPLHLFVSAHKAPHLARCGVAIHRLSDSEILAHIRQLGLVPAELLDHQAHEGLVEQILTPLRADDALLERYLWDKEQPVTVPLTALGPEGTPRDDVTLSEAQIAAWHSCTSASFTMRMFEGGHFYTESKQEAVTTFITQTIQTTIAALPKSILRGDPAPYPEKCLHELFREQAAKTPDALAIADEQGQLTFGELDQQSDLLARYLQSRGVRVDSFVGIYMENSVAYVVAYIAALKAGGAYMPIDVAYPDELLERVLETAKPVVVLTNERFYARLSEAWQAHAFQMDVEWASVGDVVVPENLPEPTIDNLAYCVMSSGTTGRPKGIICPHRGAVNSYYWRYVRYLYQEDDCEACNLFFVWEVLRPLLKGVPAVVIPGEVIYDPPRLVNFLYKHRITRMMFTASLLEQVLNLPEVELVNKLRYLRIIYLSGEVVTTALRNRFLELFPHITLLNDYSISECHDVCHYDLAESNPIYTPKYTSVGPAMDNVSVYLLDENQALVPLGFKGEIYVGGDSVGHGYLNAEMTAERFFRDPFANDGSLMFRTGDSGRILPNGHLEIQGRIAFMIKLRGYSIVPASVESAMMDHPAVNAAVVITQDNQETGQAEYLLGYVVLTMPDERLISDLRGYLKQKLPHYAIPAYIIPLDELPVSATGKLDRRNLPKPQEAMTRLKGTQVSAPPKTPTEKALAEVWESVLHIGSVERTDNFFDLGGHSLLATQIVSQIRDTFQVELPIRRIFESPTLAGLAESIEAETAHTAHKQEPQLPPLRPASRSGALPLSFAQESLWFLDQLFEDSFVYTSSEVIGLPSDFERSWLVPIFTEIVRRHEVLRTNIVMVDGRPTQVIQPPYQVVIKQPDFSTCAEGEHSIEVLIKEHAQQPFDLAEGPMLQLQLLEVEPESFSLQLTLPHLIFDGWSLNIILQEICALYEAFSNGQPSPLPDLPVQLADFALWERAWLSDEVLEPQAAYWRQQLAAPLPILALPTDHARPPIQTFRGTHQALALPADLLSDLQALSQLEGVTLFMTLLAAFDVLLYRYTHQEDILVGSTIVNRNRAELEHLVGFFTNTIVLRSDLSGSPSFRQLLSRVKKVCLEAYTHQALPFERLVDIVQPERDLSYPPLFQVMFLLLDYDYLTGELPINLSVHDVDNQTSKFDLTLCLFEDKEGLAGYFEYSTDLFNAETIVRMADHFEGLLRSIVADPDQAVQQLPMLTDSESDQILHQWNDTTVDFGEPQTIHALFEQQVERTPDAIALVFEQTQLTYSELNARANQLAHYLIELGVQADTLVAVVMERSIEMVVGLLAVLKAGGAYVPIDPTYPKERIRYMLTDSAAPILLTQHKLEFSYDSGHVIAIDRYEAQLALRPRKNPSSLRSQTSPKDLAYCIYTSGSTGRPKGVANQHDGLFNRLMWTQQQFAVTENDRFLQKTPFSFDVSVWEFFWPLMSGACLVIAQPDGHKDPEYLCQLIQKERITLIHFVPSMLRQFVSAKNIANCNSLRVIITSGEALPLDLAQQTHQTLPATSLHNLYGPTEAAIDVSHWAYVETSQTVPIGKPIANTNLYVLDSQNSLLPIGIPGELHIGGIQLAREYLNRPALTAERFIEHPEFGRLYKTGDLCRWLQDGNIEFIGRTDFQIKIRGFRIELGEIENLLLLHSGVHEAVVLARDAERNPGDKRLVAYIVPSLEKAYPVRQLMHFEQEGVLNAYNYDLLPNGMVVFYQNRSETDFMYREIFTDASYLRHGITLTDGCCVFDVGANIGIFSLFVHQQCKDPTIYTFEPIPPIFELLQLNTTLYGINATNLNHGLASISGSDTLTYYPYVSIVSGRFADHAEEQAVIQSFLMNESTGDISDAALNELLATRLQSEQITCQFKTLSEVIAEHQIPQIDLLKIDVEKSEVDILLGISENDWPKIKQVIVEVHDAQGELATIQQLLEKQGFICTIEQESMLKNTALYNLYAIHSSVQNQASKGNNAHSSDNGLLRGDYSHPTQLIQDIQKQLREQLPDYMIPSAFVTLPAMPLSPNGKLDRRALPAPDYADAKGKFVAPRNEIEALLAQTFAGVLRIPQVGIHDNFFRIGGDSILSIQLVSRLAHSGYTLSVKDVFQQPSIAQLATIIRTEQAQVYASQEAQSGDAPLLPIQRWFLDANQPEMHHFNQSFLLTVKQPIDQSQLEAAIRSLLRHHDGLRFQYAHDERGWHQQYLALGDRVPLEIVDLPRTHREVQIETICTQAQASLNPLTGELVHGVYFKDYGAEADRLLIAIHHLAVDGVSWHILLEDLTTLLDGGQLPPKTSSYRDWVLALQSATEHRHFDAEISYWLSNENTPLPLDDPDALNTMGNSHEFSLTLSETQTDLLLRTLPDLHDVTLDSVLLTALTETLTDWSDHKSLRVKFESHGRQELFENINLNRTIGWFTSAYPLTMERVEGSAVKRIGYTLARLREVTDGGISFGALHYFHPDDAIRSQFEALPKPEVVYNYLGQLDNLDNQRFGMAQEPKGVEISPDFQRETLIESNAWVQGGQLHISWTVSPQIEPETAESLLATFRRQLDSLIDETRHSHEYRELPSNQKQTTSRTLREDTAATDSWFVTLQNEGSRSPLFCLYPITGTISQFKHLIPYLSQEQPVYALQARGIYDNLPPFKTLEALASDTIRGIKTIQPTGPVNLLGWSFGARLGYEIAQQLQAQGEEAFLAILDEYPDNVQESKASVQQPVYQLLNFVYNLGTSREIDRQHLIELCQVALQQHDEHPIQALGTRLERFGYRFPFDTAMVERIYNVYLNNVMLFETYQLKPYTGSIVVFAAEESDALRATGIARWQNLVSNSVEVVNVPGTHLTVLNPEHVETLGRELEKRLQRSVNSEQ